MELPSIPEYAQALNDYGDRQVEIVMPIEGLMMILTSLQLALVHRSMFNARTVAFLEEFIAGCTAKIASVSPVIAQVIHANDASTCDPAVVGD